jgi:hypothetical protein
MNNQQDIFWRLVPALVCLPVIAYVLALSGHGLDLTDEASYINWISDPWLYPLSVTQYGFFYHPIYQLAGGDIALLRGVNILLTIGLASGLGFAILRTAGEDDRPRDIGMAAAVSIPFGFVALLFIANWLVTPNYNSLDLQGLLISAIALVLIGAPRMPASPHIYFLAAFTLLGIGGWVVFLAKPPSAALLAVVVLAYLLSVRKLALIGVSVAVGVATGLLLLTAFAVDGSISAFIVRLSDAAALSSAMDHSYSATGMLRIDHLPLPTAEKRLVFCIAILSAAAIVLGAARDRKAQVVSFVLVGVALIAAALALAGFRWFMPSNWSSRYSIQIFALPLGVVLALFGLFVWRRLSPPAAGQLQLAVVLLVFPYVFAFGTNGNYWPLAADAGVFWIAAALVLMRAVYRDWAAPRTLFPIILLPFAISVVILAIGMEYPYRQTQQVRKNDQVVEVGTRGAHLTLASDFADYIRRLQAIAREGDFRSGDPLIDLTGHYPGAPFALGAIPVGQAWMIGGYPGSEALAAAALRRVACGTLAESWLLIEPEGPRAISQAVLGEEGLRFEVAGSLASPTGSYPQSYQQYLLRPIHDSGIAAKLCEQKRRGSQSKPIGE